MEQLNTIHTFNPLEAIVFAGACALGSWLLMFLLSRTMDALHKKWHWFPDGIGL